MAYDVPSLADLSARARKIFTQSIPGAIASFWPNTFSVVAKVLAAIAFEIHLRLAWLLRQMFASTADWIWLVRHGYEYGLSPIPAQRAVGTVSLSSSTDDVIPAGVTFSRIDGAIFRSRTPTMGGPTASVQFEAITPGITGNTDAGTVLTLVDAGGIISLGSTATVGTSGLGGGAEAEDKEAFRSRVLDRKQSPPQGGSSTDWTRWTREVDGKITRVFVDSFINNSRMVWISFLRSDRPNGIPTEGDVAVVQAYVSDPVRRPITSRVVVVAPVAVPVPIVISGMTGDSPAVRGAVAAELAAAFATLATPATPSQSSTFYRAWIDEAISRAIGEQSHTLASPAGNVTLSSAPQMPVLGDITYI